MTERLHFHFSLSCIGEGNGNPLQCSCLETPRDEGAWWAAVYGIVQSRTRLKRLSSSRSNLWYHSVILGSRLTCGRMPCLLTSLVCYSSFASYCLSAESVLLIVLVLASSTHLSIEVLPLCRVQVKPDASKTVILKVSERKGPFPSFSCPSFFSFLLKFPIYLTDIQSTICNFLLSDSADVILLCQ